MTDWFSFKNNNNNNQRQRTLLTDRAAAFFVLIRSSTLEFDARCKGTRQVKETPSIPPLLPGATAGDRVPFSFPSFPSAMV